LKRIERDFITLFNCLWYQDFPVAEGDGAVGRANWTIHLGVVIRQCAKLMGAKALFEHGGRTDAVLKYPDGQILSNVEWEWIESHKDKVEELNKLRDQISASDTPPAFSTFISYSTNSNLPAALEKAKELWAQCSKPLIFFVITFERKSGSRVFAELQTHFISKGKHKKLRAQPALPWMVNRKKFNNSSDEE